MKQPYSCKPQRNSRQAKILCVALLILAVLAFYLSGMLPLFRALGQLFAVILLLLFVQITTKFLLTEYEYVLEENTLYLSSRQGKRIKNLGGIPISHRCFLFTKAQWEKREKDFSVNTRFSYCQNLFPSSPFVLLCPEGHGFVCLRFEPDETLLSLIRHVMEKKDEEVR